MGFTSEEAKRLERKAVEKEVPNSVNAEIKNFYKELFKENKEKIKEELGKLE